MKKLLLFILTLFTITFQSQTKIESAIEEGFNGSSWVNNQGYNYEYDNNNNLITDIAYSWNGSGWTEDYKTIYTYNANNKVTELVDQQWDGSSQYINSYRTVYTYNSGGSLIQILDQDWNGTQWVNSYQTVINYNSTLISTVVFFVWNVSQWINDTRSTTTYTANNLTQILNEDWNGTQWVTGDRDVFTFNTSNQMVTYMIEVWDGSAWLEEERTNYELDTNGNRIRETDNYNGSIQYKTEYDYDTSALLSNFAHPFKDKTGIDYIFEDFPYVNKVLSSFESDYDNSSNTYTLNARTTYDYNNSLTLSIESFHQVQKIKLYPNPSNRFIEITGLTKPENVRVYSVLGTKAFERVINPNDKINIQNLSNGLYFLKFENGNILKFLKK